MTLRVSVVVAWPDRQEVIECALPEGSTIADALAAARVAERFPDLSKAAVGIWSRNCERETKLREGDRVEVYRPLIADPKQMRRARARGKPRRS